MGLIRGLDNGINVVDGGGNGAKVVCESSGDDGWYAELGVDPWTAYEGEDGHGEGAPLGDGTSAFVGRAEADGQGVVDCQRLLEALVGTQDFTWES